MYTVDVLTQSGIRPDEFPSMSHSAGPLSFWTSRLHHSAANTRAYTTTLCAFFFVYMYLFPQFLENRNKQKKDLSPFLPLSRKRLMGCCYHPGWQAVGVDTKVCE